MTLFKRRKLLEKQSYGLYMIDRCMEVQIELLADRPEWLEKDGRDDEAKECAAVVRTIRYWQDEVRKAIRGEF